MLASNGKLENQPLVDDFALTGKREAMIVSALAYYMYLLKSNMSYPFYGDPKYLYTDAKLGRNSTVSSASRMVFRVFKDSRKGVRMAVQADDVTAVDSFGNKIKDKQGNTIKVGKKSYQAIVGINGAFDRGGNVTKAGSGPLFVHQEANIEYKKASSILKKAVSQLSKGDKRLGEYKEKRKFARKALLKAKKDLIKAKNKFMIRVLRYFKFKRAEELDAETVMKYFLREMKRLMMRSKDLMPLLSGINSFMKLLLGFELISYEDLEKEPDFDETPFEIEEEFAYDDLSDPWGGDDEFAF